MKPETDNKEIEEALKHICTHPLFVNSSVYSRLLRYLVDKAIAQEDIKEYTIGSDLFGKNYLTDKNDGTVRSYMYKLRKKLAAYYAEEDNNYPIIFEIKKGQYNLSFLSRKEYNKHRQEAPPVVSIPYSYLKITGISVLLLTLLVLGITYYPSQPIPIWNAYFQKDASNLLVISDQYVVSVTNQYGEKHGVMYKEINSDKDFLAYTKENPERQMENTDYTLMTKMAPYCTHVLTEWFLDNDQNFNLQLESELSFDEIKDNNIVFVGQYKTMNKSASLFLKDSKVFSTFRDGFKYKKGDEEKVYNTQFSTVKRTEYAMVSCKKLGNGNQALFFVSNNDIGTMATLKKFTDKEWLKKFSRTLPQPLMGFNALFEVSGLERTDMSCTLVELELLEKQ